MIRALAALLCALLASPALAQDEPVFPVDRSYKVVTISGYDVRTKGLSMTVTHKGGDYRAAGQAGCNTWTSAVVLRTKEIDFVDIATTKKMCGKPAMDTQEAFISALRQANRWRLDRNGLTIEGDAASLVLKPGVAQFKPERSAKPAKGRAR
jgi:heat shock protein HslJ